MYTTIEALLTTKQIKLVRNKKFATVAFNSDNETFVVYKVFLVSTNVYSSYRVQITLLILDEAIIVVPSKWTDFTNVFSLNLAAELLKNTEINDYLINLVES